MCIFAAASRSNSQPEGIPLCVVCLDESTACDGIWDKSKKRCSFDALKRCYSSRVCSGGGTRYREPDGDE
jgi:hypothetical protein